MRLVFGIHDLVSAIRNEEFGKIRFYNIHLEYPFLAEKPLTVKLGAAGRRSMCSRSAEHFGLLQKTQWSDVAELKNFRFPPANEKVIRRLMERFGSNS